MSSWNFSPYTPVLLPDRAKNPYICRIEPHVGGFTMDFIDNSPADSNRYELCYKKRGENGVQKTVCHMHDGYATVTVSCEDDCNFEVYVKREDGACSSVRLVRTGYVPGKVINYLHPEDEEYAFSGKYLASPSLLRTPSGRLLASMDVFGSADNLTMIFASDDNGETWKYCCDIFPCFWGKLFCVGEDIYLLGASCEYGDLLLGKSTDDGHTFCAPTVLFRGSGMRTVGGFHKAPNPVAVVDNRLYADIQYGSWSIERIPRFVNLAVSVSLDDDIMNASNWTCSKNADVYDGSYIYGAIEGSLVKTPEGRLVNIIRFDTRKWVLMEVDTAQPENAMKFVDFLELPSTASKCSIQYDEISGCYFALVSYHDPECDTQRNLLSLIYSRDLYTWHVAKHVLDCRHMDRTKIGFQYTDQIIDGDDLLFLSRTAYNGAHNFHDSNYQTLHRIENFRSLFAD